MRFLGAQLTLGIDQLLAFMLFSSLLRTQRFEAADLNAKVLAPRLEAIKVLLLRGNQREVGRQYGAELKKELRISLEILIKYVIKQGGSYERMVYDAEMFHFRYSYTYSNFLVGMSEGSGLPLNDCKILNGMETIRLSGEKVYKENSLNAQCAYLFIPAERTVLQRGSLIARNYDYSAPFDQIARYLTVTILQESDKLSTAIIALPGQIYCPSCVNSAGVFVELNNGGPSGGFQVDLNRKSMTINLLEFAQQADTLKSMEAQLLAAQSDYSLIINIGDAKNSKSFEYSSTLGSKPMTPSSGTPFASTNFFLNTTWGSAIPVPADSITWFGVSRRDNLLELVESSQFHDVQTVKAIMDVRLEDGGAVWNNTIYQMIFDAGERNFYIRRAKYEKTWTTIGYPTEQHSHDHRKLLVSSDGTSSTRGFIKQLSLSLFLAHYLIMMRIFREG